MTTPEQDDNSHRWTHVTLRDYVDSRLQEIEKGINAQIDASRLAVKKSEDAVTYRLQSLNEFREAMNDQQKSFATRHELESLREKHNSQINALARQVYIIVGALLAVEMLLRFFA